MSGKNKTVGQKIGKLELIEFYSKSTGYDIKRKAWKVRCECGTVLQLEERNLDRLKHKSCGCATLKNNYKPGDKVGRLTLSSLYIEKKYSNNINVRCWESVCDCGNIVRKAESYYNNAKNPSCGCENKLFKVESGQRFNSLVFIESGTAKTFNLQKKNKSSTVWKCQCDCGQICYKMADAVYYNKVKSCGCQQAIFGQFGQESKRWLGYGELPKSYYNQTKTGAEIRGLEFNVSIEYLYDLYLQQNKKCALSGQELIFSTQHRRENYGVVMNASLDRIDSSTGYVEGNLQWVLSTINIMKTNFTMERFLYYCKLVTQKNWLNIFNNPILDYKPSRKRCGRWKGCGEISGKSMNAVRTNAKNRNIPITVSINFLWDLYLKQGGKCALSGLSIGFPKFNKDEQTASLDRIDSSKSYNENNVWWVHKNLNIMKWDLTVDELYNYCKLITDYTSTSTSMFTIA